MCRHPTPDGINELTVTPQEAGTAFYNLMGTRLSRPQRGLNIIRTADGKTRKVLVKAPQ